jgi:hypothetical protein
MSPLAPGHGKNFLSLKRPETIPQQKFSLLGSVYDLAKLVEV